jgi:hypothetical protein
VNEYYGLYYCYDHHPAKRTCKFNQIPCRKKWYSYWRDYTGVGLCYLHGKGEESKRMNGIYRDKCKYQGQCCFIKIRKNGASCQKRALKDSDYCFRHQGNKENKHKIYNTDLKSKK